MSLGSGIGGVVGGIIGFVASGYNPYGAYVGFSLGATIGMAIDPIQPDVAKPDTADLSVPTAKEGLPVADVLGTSPVVGNILWYANPRTEEVKESGGKGGAGGYVSGYKYYLSFSIGLCLGPIDAVYCIYENENLLWPAEGEAANPVTIADATNGKVTLTVPDRGTIDFYFGTDDQTASATMTNFTGYALPYKGLCYAVFNDFMIGDYNRMGSFKFILRKTPEQASFNANHRIGDYDYNPAHVIRHMLTNLRGIDPSRIDEVGLSVVADTLNTEGLGVSLCCSQDGSVLNYLESVLSHIYATVHYSADGKLTATLLRNDVNPASMITIDENDILEEIDMNRPGLGDTNNQITSTFTELTVES